MFITIMLELLKKGLLTLLLLTSLLLPACATFKPGSLDEIPLNERADALEQDGLRVSVAVLSRTEASEVFGTNLHDRRVQPVWIKIENNTEKPFWLMLHSLDPNYFSTNEVAYMNHMSFGGKQNRRMDAHFFELGIRKEILPGQTNSGFAFTNETLGTKEVRVRLLSNEDVRDFEFFVSAPGLISDWKKRNLLGLYSEDELIHASSEEELRGALAKLPCCMQNQFNNAPGLPINVVLVGSPSGSALAALIKAGWSETAFSSDLGAFFGSSYLFGRSPDVQFQKNRRRVNSTILLRIWVTPIRYNGQIVSAGSIKRSIDPNIDEAAMYLAEDLATARTVKRFGFVSGVDEVARDTPKQSFANDPYWTKGRRLVLEIPGDLVPLEKLRAFSWDWEDRIIFHSGAPAND